MAEEERTTATEAAEAPAAEPEVNSAAPEAEAPTAEAPEADVPEAEAPAADIPPEAPPTPPPTQFMPSDEKKGIAEQFRIIKQRRLLRKDLKAKGITKRKDFNEIAEAMGLVLWKISPFTIWLHHALKGIFAGVGLKWLAGAAAAGLVTIFLVSTITEEKGSFTINLTGDMLNAGYALSDTVEFKDEKVRLFADRLEDVNNITMTDIDPKVDNIDGAHNGENYFAYTFYIKNTGKRPSSYAYYFRMTSETLGVTKAAWIMLFEDGRQVIYSRPQDDKGTPEALQGFDRPLMFSDVAYSKDQYYTYRQDGKTLYGIKTTPYANDSVVAQGLVEDVKPDEVHKYTVVIWLEGYDPECTDDIFGGYAKFQMDFEYIEDENESSLFDGVFRTEYEEYSPDAEGETNTPPASNNGGSAAGNQSTTSTTKPPNKDEEEIEIAPPDK